MYLSRLIPLTVCSLLALTGCDNEFKLGADADVGHLVSGLGQMRGLQQRQHHRRDEQRLEHEAVT